MSDSIDAFRHPHGRPRYEPTSDQRNKVRVLSANAVSQKTIAEIIGIDGKTLRRHFP